MLLSISDILSLSVGVLKKLVIIRMMLMMMCVIVFLFVIVGMKWIFFVFVGNCSFCFDSWLFLFVNM